MAHFSHILITIFCYFLLTILKINSETIIINKSDILSADRF